MAAVECPWFIEWFRGMASGKAVCIHCGGNGRDAGLIGAAQVDDDQLVTITACRECCARSVDFEAAARAAVDAAEAGVLTRGRSFMHSVDAPETTQ